MTCEKPCPNCGERMSFVLFVNTDGGLYVTAYGTCSACGAKFDAHGLSPTGSQMGEMCRTGPLEIK